MDPNTMKKRRTLAGTRTTATTSTTATTATTTAAAAAAATTQPNTTRVSSFTRQHDPTTTASSVAPPTRSQFETSTPHATATAAVAAEVKATAREDQKPESEATAAGTSNSNTTVPPYDSSYSLEVLKDLPGLRSRVRRHVHSVIQCLPPSQTLAYREAMRRDASLVDTETDPLQFVRYCKYDIGQGARRLCAYWTERLKLFSPKRAFLPLTLTGTGALTEQDIDTLRAGYPSLIESTNHNNNNNINNNSSGTFMLIDRRRKMASTTTDQILRAMFYCMAILAADPMSQWEGARLVVMSVSPRSHNVDFSLIHRGASLNATCFPVWPKLYLVGIPLAKRPTFSQGLIKAMVFLLRQYFQTEIYICLQETTTNHNNKGDPNNNPSNNNNNANSILEQLLALGFDRNDIPQSFGGYWSFDRFGQWLRERQQMEYENYKDRLLKKPPTAATAATTTTTSSDDGAAAGIHDPSTKDHHVATTTGNASLVPPAYSNAFGYSGAFSPNLMGGGGGNGFGGGAAAGFAALSASLSSSSNFPSMTTPTAQTAPTVATDIFALASSSLSSPAVLWHQPPQPPPNRLHPTTVAAGLPAAMTRGSAGPAMSSSATLHARAATASAAVAPNPEGDDEEEERLSKKRMSNLLASRKVRERFCNRLQTLQEQKSSLTKEQERLQVEHDKLTRLCHQAEYTVRTILHLDDPEDLDNDDDHDDDDDNCDNHDDDNNNVSEN